MEKMKKLIATALAAVLVVSFVFAGYSAQAMPAVKTAVGSSDLKEVKMSGLGGTEVISTQIKVSGEPKDLAIAFTAECSLVTNVKLTGKKDATDESSSRATITVEVWVDDVLAEPGEVVFADRLMRVKGKLNETEWFEIYMETRNANGFNFIAKDVGTGVHTITVVATMTGTTEGDTGSEDTLSLIGKRTLVVNEINLK